MFPISQIHFCHNFDVCVLVLYMWYVPLTRSSFVNFCFFLTVVDLGILSPECPSRCPSSPSSLSSSPTAPVTALAAIRMGASTGAAHTKAVILEGGAAGGWTLETMPEDVT